MGFVDLAINPVNPAKAWLLLVSVTILLMFTDTNSSWTSFKICVKYTTSWHATDNNTYSALHVQRATDDCFFYFQLIAGLLPDNTDQ